MSKKTGLNLRHALCGALLSLAAFPAQAVVSIGDISVQSFRDETLKALVELKADAGDTLTPQCLSLVKPDAEADNKLPYLTDGVVALDQRGGKQVVSITTTQAISGDGINLMLKIECPGQVQISRDFTVLLGTRSGNVLALPAAAPAAPTQSSALPPLPASGGFYWDMRAGDSLADIAQKIYPKEPLYQKKMVRAIIRANPQAFPDGKMQELSVGTVIIIPDLRSVPAVKVPEESGADKAPAKPQRKSRPPPAAKNEPPGEKTTTKSLIRGSQYLLKISWQLDSLPFPSHSETSRQFNRQTAESPYLAKIAELTQRLARADSELEKLRLKLATVFSRAEEVKRAIAQLETLSSAAKATPNRAAKTPPSVEKPASTAPPAAKTATAPEVKTAQMPAPIVKPAAPAVKAAPAAEKPVTRPEQQDDMLTWLVAGIVIVLLSLGAFYYYRKRKRSRALATAVAELGTGMEPSLPPTRMETRASSPPSIAHFEMDEKIDSKPAAPHMDLLLENAGEQPGVADQQVDVELLFDPTRSLVDDVDRFVALGRPKGAINLLLDQINKHKNDRISWLKLLSIYYNEGMATDFDKSVREFKSIFRDKVSMQALEKLTSNAPAPTSST